MVIVTQNQRFHGYSNPESKIPWRNWLARPTVNREVAGSSPAGIVFLLL